MNRLLELSFAKSGYDYDFLNNLRNTYYDDNFVFPGEGDIILALEELRKSGKKLVIYPDFDMDGISAGCVLYLGLLVLGLNVALYDPDVTRGYGMTVHDINSILTKWTDTSAIITCDVGSTCGEAIDYAMSKSIPVYVTDHHFCASTSATEIMNPSFVGQGLPFTGMCGAWVAYHLVSTYAKLVGDPAKIALIEKLLIPVGLGSCGDMMPVLHDTRSSIITSLEEFNKLTSTDNPLSYLGIKDDSSVPDQYKAFFEALFMLHNYLLNEGAVRGAITDETYGFTYCPMFNSIKRMGGEMSKLYEMLYVRHSYKDFAYYAEWLIGLNNARKTLSNSLYNSLINDPRQLLAPYVYVANTGRGILGLIANKIMDATGSPCVVVTADGMGGYVGSGRISEGHKVYDLISGDGFHADGHVRSFGVKADDADSLLRMASFLETIPKYTEDDTERPIRNRTIIAFKRAAEKVPAYDFLFDTAHDYGVCVEYVSLIDVFRPFGIGFSEPEFEFVITGEDIFDMRTMGADKTHLKISLKEGPDLVWFGGAGHIEDIAALGEGTMSFYGTLRMNEFCGKSSLQMLVSGCGNDI